MKKARKLGLQSLALVLMAFVLVAGVAFGMTGAWFVNKDAKESDAIVMGHGVYTNLTEFALTKKSGEGSTSAVMPGDVYTNATAIKVTTTESTSAMYLFFKIEITGDSNMVGATVETPTGTPTAVVGSTHGWKYYTVAAKVANADVQELYAADGITVTVPKTWENDKASVDGENGDKTLTVKVTVIGIQQANVDVTDISDAKLEAYALGSSETGYANLGADEAIAK